MSPSSLLWSFTVMIERLFFQGVESERCPSFTAAMKAGKPVKIDVNQAMTLADGK
jgi:threonine dehydratase